MDINKALEVVRSPEMVLVIGHQLLAETMATVRQPAPTRARLAKELSEYLGEPINDRKLDVLFTEYATRLGRHGMISFLRDRLPYYGCTPPVWAALASWKVASVINFSWADLYSGGCRKIGLTINIVIQKGDLDYIRPEHRSVVHLRGLVNRPDTMVITLEDFYHATSYDYPKWRVWKYAAGQMNGRPLLMLGMDWDEVKLLNQYLINRFDVQPAQQFIVSRANCWSNGEVASARACDMEVLLLAASVADFVRRVTDALS